MLQRMGVYGMTLRSGGTPESSILLDYSETAVILTSHQVHDEVDAHGFWYVVQDTMTDEYEERQCRCWHICTLRRCRCASSGEVGGSMPGAISLPSMRATWTHIEGIEPHLVWTSVRGFGTFSPCHDPSSLRNRTITMHKIVAHHTIVIYHHIIVIRPHTIDISSHIVTMYMHTIAMHPTPSLSPCTGEIKWDEMQ